MIESFENEREGDLGPRLIPRGSFHDLSNVEITMSNALREGIFITTKTSHFSFRMFGRSELSKSREGLTTHGGADFKIVTENGFVCSGSRNGDFSGGIRAGDFDDGLALVFYSKDAEETVDFAISIGRPDGEMVSGLVGKAGAFEGDFHVKTIPLLGSEKLARLDNGGNEGIVRRIRTFRSRKVLP